MVVQDEKILVPAFKESIKYSCEVMPVPASPVPPLSSCTDGCQGSREEGLSVLGVSAENKVPKDSCQSK